MSYSAGRHFLQIPGPTNVPDAVLRAMDRPTIDHRGPQFGALAQDVLQRIRLVFQTEQPVVIFPSSGTGAWEAALVNTLSPGDKVLMYETGHFATLWSELAGRLELQTQLLPGDWRSGVDASVIEAVLAEDTQHAVKAVCLVHNETSTGVTSKVAPVRTALDRLNHPALLMVDTISSLGSIDYRHDEWGVDVTVGGSQKGLMLPPGLGFNAISERALGASRTASCSRSYWDWQSMLGPNANGYFPYTPATNLLYGLKTALDLLFTEGLDNVFARHDRHAEATRRAVRAWGLDTLCRNEDEHSSSLTAVMMPEGYSGDELRKLILDRFDMSLGSGLGKVSGKIFRIGHLGDFNDLSLAGTLAGVEMGLQIAGLSLAGRGVVTAMDYLIESAAVASAPIAVTASG